MNSDQIRIAFKETFQQEAAVVVRSPGRINLLGEHTDYNDGFVLPAAIDLAMFVAVAKAERQSCWVALDKEDKVELRHDQLEWVEGHWSNYIKGVVTELQKRGFFVPEFNAVFGGNIPEGAGLSSSAALETGFLVALDKLFDLGLSRLDIVQLAQAAENNFVGVNCGIMDMYANMMGREGQLLQLDCRSLEVSYLPFNDPNYCLLLCNSRVKHALVDSAYNARRRSCEEGVAVLQQYYPTVRKLRDVSMEMLQRVEAQLDAVTYRRCKYVIEEAFRMQRASAALQNRDFRTVGQIMFETHEGLRRDYEVSCPELDYLVEQAKAFEGVLGARMMGGGFGGCSINLIEVGHLDLFKAKIKEQYQNRFQIEPAFYEVHLSGGTSID